MMYCATWVHVTDFIPPRTEQNSTPSSPTNTPTLKSRPMKRDTMRPTPVTWAIRYVKEHATAALPASVKPVELLNKLCEAEHRRRERFSSRLARAADAYIVRRGEGKTIIAGYPWFTDWGRDTLIALRGLCVATGRLDVARDILVAWSATVSEGMLPNRFGF